MKIGLLTSVGITLESFFPQIVRHWEDAGAAVATAAGSPAIGFRENSVIPGLTRNPSLTNVMAIPALREWVSQTKINVVITNTGTASALSRVRPLGVPVIYFCHGLHWGNATCRSSPYRAVEKRLLRNTAGVICMNSADSQWFSSAAPGIPLCRLLSGVGLDTKRFPRRDESVARSNDEIRLVWCGEFSQRKNPKAAVETAFGLADRGVAFRLEMLGDGPLLPAVKKKAAALQGRVAFHGRVDPAPYFYAADALVQTARWEGLPRVALEAVAIGLPTVGFDAKGVRDIPGVYLAPCDDYVTLADQIIIACANGAQNLPPTEELGFEHAARRVLQFTTGLVS